MLNKLISLLFLFVFFNIKTVNSETNFLLPKEKPSIFQKVKNQITENTSKNLPMPKPRLEEKKTVKKEPKQQKGEIKEKQKKKR